MPSMSRPQPEHYGFDATDPFSTAWERAKFNDVVIGEDGVEYDEPRPRAATPGQPVTYAPGPAVVAWKGYDGCCARQAYYMAADGIWRHCQTDAPLDLDGPHATRPNLRSS